MWSLEVPGHLEVLDRERGAVCGLEVVQVLLSLRKEGRAGRVQSTAGSISHQTPHPQTHLPLYESCHFRCLQSIPCPQAPLHPRPLRHPFLLPALHSPETKPAASFHLHSCPPLQRGSTQRGSGIPRPVYTPILDSSQPPLLPQGLLTHTPGEVWPVFSLVGAEDRQTPVFLHLPSAVNRSW